MHRATPPQSQRGLSLIEILLWLGLLAGVAIFAAGQFSAISAGVDSERAYVEIQKVIAAGRAFRSSVRRGGSYAGVTVMVLSDQGYNVAPLTSGTGENAFGRNITFVPANSGADATLTYQTNNDEQCQQLIERFTNAPALTGTPTCATNTLTMTVD